MDSVQRANREIRPSYAKTAESEEVGGRRPSQSRLIILKMESRYERPSRSAARATEKEKEKVEETGVPDPRKSISKHLGAKRI